MKYEDNNLFGVDHAIDADNRPVVEILTERNEDYQFGGRVWYQATFHFPTISYIVRLTSFHHRKKLLTMIQRHKLDYVEL